MMHLYIILSGFYRLLCGALILAINWRLATQNNGDFGALALATVMSFVPALFVPVLAKRALHRHSGSKLTAVGLFGVLLCCLTLALFHKRNAYIVVLNFLIWTFFFLLESSWEMWFTALAKDYEDRAVSKFSSLSMTVNQIALMIGPICAPSLVGWLGDRLFYFVAAMLFGGFGLVTFWMRQGEPSQEEASLQKAEVRDFDWLLFLSLALVWPVLGSFNFMLPVQISIQKGDMLDVGLLDAFMGIGMAAIGLLFAWGGRFSLLAKIGGAFFFILIGALTWLFGGFNLLRYGIAVALLGMGFGGLRILIRHLMARRYSGAEVGKLVSRANALALPILTLSLGLSQLSISHTWFLPFLFALVMSLFLYLGARKEAE